MTAVPVLDCSGHEPSFDWPAGSYDVAVRGPLNRVTVKHTLREAAPLVDAVSDGNAKYAVECRSCTTFWAAFHHSDSCTHTIETNRADHGGNIDFWPGVVAVADFDLPTKQLSSSWQRQGETVRVFKGVWLARGAPYSEDLRTSIVRFKADRELNEGRMRLEYSAVGSQPYFIVWCHRKLLERANDSDFYIWAFALALSRLEVTDDFRTDQTNPPKIVEAVRSTLQAKSLPAWDEDGWDPLAAATTLLAFPSKPDRTDDG